MNKKLVILCLSRATEILELSRNLAKEDLFAAEQLELICELLQEVIHTNGNPNFHVIDDIARRGKLDAEKQITRYLK
jgi:hypothetical protein